MPPKIFGHRQISDELLFQFSYLKIPGEITNLSLLKTRHFRVQWVTTVNHFTKFVPNLSYVIGFNRK